MFGSALSETVDGQGPACRTISAFIPDLGPIELPDLAGDDQSVPVEVACVGQGNSAADGSLQESVVDGPQMSAGAG